MNTIDNSIFGTFGHSETIDPETWTLAPAYRCHLLIVNEEDGTFSAIVLNLPGAGSCGDTEDEAIENAKEAVRGLIASYEAAGDHIPWKKDGGDVPSGGKHKWVLVDA